MGYTHYYTQTRDFTLTEWQEIKNALSLMLSHLPSNVIISGYDGRGKPKITDQVISLNGRHELAHETFLLARRAKAYCKRNDFTNWIDQSGHVHFFCKTERKPYDLLVCAMLLAVTEIAPSALLVSSDGDCARS